MCRDFSSEVKKWIADFKERGFEFGKSEAYLKHRIRIGFEEMKFEISECNKLVFTGKREINGEIRYTLYFVYSKKKGRAYALTFRNKIRVITAFPLGKRTLNKYFRQRFKKSERHS